MAERTGRGLQNLVRWFESIHDVVLISGHPNASAGEIFFTSGGTEADNTAILSAVRGMGIKRVITSSLEHHAVLHTLQALERSGEIVLLQPVLITACIRY